MSPSKRIVGLKLGGFRRSRQRSFLCVLRQTCRASLLLAALWMSTLASTPSHAFQIQDLSPPVRHAGAREPDRGCAGLRHSAPGCAGASTSGHAAVDVELNVPHRPAVDGPAQRTLHALVRPIAPTDGVTGIRAGDSIAFVERDHHPVRWNACVRELDWATASNDGWIRVTARHCR
jgi:hypothetical protein